MIDIQTLHALYRLVIKYTSENILSIAIKIYDKIHADFSVYVHAAWINLLFLGGYYGTRTHRTTTEIGVLLLNW